MGFILRNTKNFRQIRTFKILYFALMRSHLEFGMLIWNPFTQRQIEAIEAVQRHFLKHLFYRVYNYYPSDLTYNDLLQCFDSLEIRRKVALLIFLRDILQGHTNTVLLQEIKFRIPRPNARIKSTFYVETSRTEYSTRNIIRRACKLYNEIQNDQLDIFFQPNAEYKKECRHSLLN